MLAYMTWAAREATTSTPWWSTSYGIPSKPGALPRAARIWPRNASQPGRVPSCGTGRAAK
eukprot:11613245-Prorocentrum_lima.AAC.1